MDDKLYRMMKWPEIEAVCYAEHDNPHQVLGPHVTTEGVMVGAFFPDAKQVTINYGSKKQVMELADEMGYFVALLPGNKVVNYTLTADYEGGSETVVDPYSFSPVITEEECKLFSAGINYTIYEKLGAHPMTINGVDGVLFAVWSPNVMRVSVVGDFNNWDGRKHQMRRLGNSGIFEIFIPGVNVGEIYKFEIKVKGGLTYLKADPYASSAELRPGTASKVADLESFKWEDDEWLAQRAEGNAVNKPMLIYEVHLGSWKKPSEENGSFYNYREIAVMLADYCLEYGYTHIELMPVMEHPLDASWGYQVTGYYATTARYGSPEDFMYFMNYMHRKGIGVILDWVPAHFPRDTFGLSNFDGTCLYEHFDPRKGSHPHWGTLIFNYGRPQVSNFLIANALYWVEKFHADGIRMDAVASMLYLDYGKNDGEWIPNIYGGKENLEAIELIKHLNSIMKKRNKGVLMIAEESTAWPKITGDVEDDGLGFDFKWNMGWMNDYTTYMRQDPLFRKGCHGLLTFSMIYAYSENFILVFSHDEVVHGKGSMLNKMPGTIEDKFDNLRAAYGYMMCHPGKKLLFMGQEFGQVREWSEERSLDWNLIEEDEKHAQMAAYTKALFKLYRDYPALSAEDQDPHGFEWMSCLDADRSMVSFVRRTENPDETLYVICNFTPNKYEKLAVGVPFMGKYKEILNSDDVKFGGSGMVNPRLKQSKEIKVDGRPNSIEIAVPPLGIAIFTCKEIVKAEKAVKSEKTAKAVKSEKAEKPAKEGKAEKTVKAKAEKAEKAKAKTKKKILK
ncbi:MAG: 1,4-alpha-glucan branching protein GlgB [Lachnospiraceae bacterium]|nr:1,4-alpha-glucan branching protein GlgB [Lachnospiraceae bacterium]